MRFLDCSSGSKIPSASILDEGGVDVALSQAGHDAAMFLERGGLYRWKKDEMLEGNAGDVEDMPAGFGLQVFPEDSRHADGGC
mmetsp:Transcript_67682/g.220329  ORF Transcript_67682/g.220329 Transcript_67682/m.220329 type:complete len:83 (+) Transcript_67682:1-249(+)